MRDEARTQEELISELIQLRRRITELEKSVCKRRQTEEELRNKTEELEEHFSWNEIPHGGFTPHRHTRLRFSSAVTKLSGISSRKRLGCIISPLRFLDIVK